mmetsp:Transcript_40985/g.88820  ORF Transcript_40985/g.88820 Transcript_40985/m.88820 type:complete len:215 (+) Transcript_40985:311-955(+)
MHIATSPHVWHRVQTKQHQEERPIRFHQRRNLLASSQWPLEGHHSDNVQVHQVSKAILIPGNHHHLHIGKGQQDPADHSGILIPAHHGSQQAQEQRPTHMHQNQWCMSQHRSIELDPFRNVFFLKGLGHDIRIPGKASDEECQGSGRNGTPEDGKELGTGILGPVLFTRAQGLPQGLGKGSHDQEHHHEEHLKDGVAKVVLPVSFSHHISKKIG